MKETKFSFERGRGVVWVCDVANSSKYLNDDESVMAMEGFLPRLHWMGKLAVNAAGGQFVKWTGDGFLGWFPTELHRELGSQSAKVMEIIWHLTLMNNVTKLGIEEGNPFQLRHGLTIEHDALITNISDEQGEFLDLIGRSVVLSFRLSGIKAGFPGIVTHKEVVEAISNKIPQINFKKLNLSAEEKLKYFKGERWGTNNLWVSANRKPRIRSLNSLLRRSKKAIATAEGEGPIPKDINTILQFITALKAGPDWAKGIYQDYLNFVREDLLEPLKGLVDELETSNCRTRKIIQVICG